MKKVLVIFLSLYFSVINISQAVSTDTCFDTDTKLMLHYDGSDGSTTFTDSSSTGRSMTANGNAQIDTAQSKFGGASGLFDGTGDYVSTSDSNDWFLGTGDFTIDVWVRFSTISHSQFIVSQYDGANQQIHYLWWDSGGGGFIETTGTDISGSGTVLAFAAWSASANVWYHVAVVRSSTVFKYYIDGTGLSTTSDTDSLENSGGNLKVGQNAVASGHFEGWMDELRFIKGTAVWTANFTPPSTSYTSCVVAESGGPTCMGVSGTFNAY